MLLVKTLASLIEVKAIVPTIQSLTMMKRPLLCSLLMVSATANAQYANVEGQFRSQRTSLDLIALDSESGVIAATTTVVQGSCSGSVAGVGKVVKNVLTFSPYTKVDKPDACVITVTFDKNKNTAKVKGSSCSMYSGAANQNAATGKIKHRQQCSQPVTYLCGVT